MIKFTIVTCTYNAEAVLQRTLDSVMKQTYCNIEHLIIDGVSKDKTLTMVKAYQHKNDVGRVLTKSSFSQSQTKDFMML